MTRRKSSRHYQQRRERDEDLLNTFKGVYSRSPVGSNLENVLRNVVNQKSKRFWVSSERTFIIISRIEQGDDLSYMRERKRAMFMEIYSRYLILKRLYPSKRKIDILDDIIENEAPSFYLTPGSASVLIHYIRKKRICERQKL